MRRNPRRFPAPFALLSGGAARLAAAPAPVREGVTFLVFLVFAVLWSAPAAWGDVLLGRQPDAPGTVWFLHAAPRLVHGLHDPLTGGAGGVTYARPDSFVLMAVGWAFQGVSPFVLYRAVAVFGIAVSAWAAEAFARALGARFPWSLVAGFAFMGCGLATTALLEGYVYHVFDPWLPLFGMCWWRATRPSGRARDGVLAGVFFVLTVLTTAWLGIAAGVLLVGILAARLGGALVGGRPDEPSGLGVQGAEGARPLRNASPASFGDLASRGTSAVLSALGRVVNALPLPPLAAAALTVAAPLYFYVKTFLGAADSIDASIAAHVDLTMHLRSVARHLALPDISVDADGDFQSAALGPTTLVLLAAAPVALRHVRGWRAIAVAGVLALGVSLLPRVDPSTWVSVLPTALQAPVTAVAGSLLRFPERPGWAWVLCAGVLAARVLTELARVRGAGAASLLFVAALLDVFVGQRLPFRQRATTTVTPSAYRAGTGPVLDLWPMSADSLPAWTLRTTNEGCLAQAGHHRPIADHCIFVYGTRSPRLTVGVVVSDALLRGDVVAAHDALVRAGFTTLAWHPDVFRASDRNRLASTLAQLDPDPVESTDGGDHVVAYAITDRVPTPASSSPSPSPSPSPGSP